MGDTAAPSHSRPGHAQNASLLFVWFILVNTEQNSVVLLQEEEEKKKAFRQKFGKSKFTVYRPGRKKKGRKKILTCKIHGT